MSGSRTDNLNSRADAVSQSDWLSFESEFTARFCGLPAVFVIVQLVALGGSPPRDPDPRNNRVARQINLMCDGGWCNASKAIQVQTKH